MRKPLCCLLVALFSIASSLVHASLPRYDDGARWAFVSEQNTSRVAVVDTFEFKLAGFIELKTTPTQMEVSDVQDLLVYIDGKSQKVFSFDLVKHTHSEIDLGYLPEDITFHSDGAQLAVAGPDRIDIIHPLKQQHITTITGITSPFSMIFDNGGYNLYIAEKQSGKTLVYRNHDGKQSHIQMGSGNISELTLSPDARLALVSDFKTNEVIVHDLFNETPYQRYKMAAKPWRPYVSSDSEHMIFVAEDGKAIVTNTWSGERVNEIMLGEAPRSIRTGWLETIGIVESKSMLSIFTLTGEAPVTQVRLTHPLNDVVVVSDSRTLYATQQNSSQLFIYDIRSQSLRPAIDTGLTHPTLVAMGITNTICH